MGPNLLFSIDPGLRECGVALLRLEDGALLAAWLSRSPEKERRHNPGWSSMALQVLADLAERFPTALATPEWAWFLGETPELHKRNRSSREQKVDPNALFQTAGASAAVGAVLALQRACLVEHQHGVLADTWTGGKRKNLRQRAARLLPQVDEEIAWEELPAGEQAVVEKVAKSYLHHVLDAVDMARWFRVHWKLAVTTGQPLRLPAPAPKKRKGKQLHLLATPPAGERKTFGQQLREQGRIPGLGSGFTPARRRAARPG